MGGDAAMIVAGIGCRRLCDPAEIVAVLRDAETRAGLVATSIAVPAFKTGDGGPIAAAARLGLPLLLIDDDAIAAAQPGCVTLSDTVRRHTGHAAIAEAVALAASGPNARLILPRIAHPNATCALAESPT